MTTKRKTLGQLPILIRYKAQDYQTRYVDDPRILYIDEFRALHPDDGFVALIPSEASAKRSPSSRLSRCCRGAALLISLSWVAYALLAG